MTDHMKRSKPIPEHIQRWALENYYDLPEHGCHVSMARRNPTNGYCYISGFLAHRAAWTAANGYIPRGMVVDHMCFNRLCVNPEHLRLLTNGENVQRRKGRDFPRDGGCAWGHPATSMKWFEYPSRPRLTCAECIDENNWITMTMRRQIRLLELAYGLGGHENKKNYATEIRKRNERVAAVRGVIERAAA